MTTEPIVEYRAVWPNGSDVGAGKIYVDKDAFLDAVKEFTDRLAKNNVPDEYWPRLEARVTERTVYEWRSLDETEAEVNRREQVHEEVRTTSGPKHVIQPNGMQWNDQQVAWGAPTADQVARVKAGQFGFQDPCVICGIPFQICQHDTFATEGFINMVKRRGF